MFRNILVPVDFSLKTDAALNAALDLARGVAGVAGSSAEPARVTLLHVVETIEHVEFDEMKDFYHGLETRAIAKLYGMQERFTALGIPAVHEVAFGKRAETILHHAEDKGIDLIVLSSHKVDRDHPALGVGTISYRIAIVARCPVLLVK